MIWNLLRLTVPYLHCLDLLIYWVLFGTICFEFDYFLWIYIINASKYIFVSRRQKSKRIYLKYVIKYCL